PSGERCDHHYGNGGAEEPCHGILLENGKRRARSTVPWPVRSSWQRCRRGVVPETAGARRRAPRLHENAVTARGRPPPPHPPAARVLPLRPGGRRGPGCGGATRRVATAGA